MNVAGRRIDTDPIHWFGPDGPDRRTLCGARIGGNWSSGSYLDAAEVGSARDAGEEFCQRCAAAYDRGVDIDQVDPLPEYRAALDTDRKALKRAMSAAVWALDAYHHAIDPRDREIARARLLKARDAAAGEFALFTTELEFACSEFGVMAA